MDRTLSLPFFDMSHTLENKSYATVQVWNGVEKDIANYAWDYARLLCKKQSDIVVHIQIWSKREIT